MEQQMTTDNYIVPRRKALLYVSFPPDFRTSVGSEQLDKALKETLEKWTEHFPELELFAVPDFRYDGVTHIEPLYI
jgi:hypothetical protein